MTHTNPTHSDPAPQGLMQPTSGGVATRRGPVRWLRSSFGLHSTDNTRTRGALLLGRLRLATQRTSQRSPRAPLPPALRCPERGGWRVRWHHTGSVLGVTPCDPSGGAASPKSLEPVGSRPSAAPRRRRNAPYTSPRRSPKFSRRFLRYLGIFQAESLSCGTPRRGHTRSGADRDTLRCRR